MKDLDELLKSGIEDEQLSDLLSLKQHPGFKIYLNLLVDEVKRTEMDMYDPKKDHAATNYLRGQLQAYRVAIYGLGNLIERREEELKQEV